MDGSPSGSYLGCLTANRWSGHEWRMETRGQRRCSLRRKARRNRLDPGCGEVVEPALEDPSKPLADLLDVVMPTFAKRPRRCAPASMFGVKRGSRLFRRFRVIQIRGFPQVRPQARSSAFAVTTSLRMTAVTATLCGLPLSFNRSWNAAISGLKLQADIAAM